jgi:large subunit ribosomal protein L17
MRHRRKVKRFNRKFNHRKAMFKGLICSLVEHGRIKTTVSKAKELRKHVEKAITFARGRNDLATLRLLTSRIGNVDTAQKIIKEISPRFTKTPGGYTRIIKIGARPGDLAEMAFIEFVDYDFKANLKTVKSVVSKGGSPKDASDEGTKDSKAAKSAKSAKEANKESKNLTKEMTKENSKVIRSKNREGERARKHVRKMKNTSRQENRA